MMYSRKVANRVLARIFFKLPVIFERVLVQNGLKRSKMG